MKNKMLSQSIADTLLSMITIEKRFSAAIRGTDAEIKRILDSGETIYSKIKKRKYFSWRSNGELRNFIRWLFLFYGRWRNFCQIKESESCQSGVTNVIYCLRKNPGLWGVVRNEGNFSKINVHFAVCRIGGSKLPCGDLSRIANDFTRRTGRIYSRTQTMNRRIRKKKQKQLERCLPDLASLFCCHIQDSVSILCFASSPPK